MLFDLCTGLGDNHGSVGQSMINVYVSAENKDNIIINILIEVKFSRGC